MNAKKKVRFGRKLKGFERKSYFSEKMDRFWRKYLNFREIIGKGFASEL